MIGPDYTEKLRLLLCACDALSPKWRVVLSVNPRTGCWMHIGVRGKRDAREQLTSIASRKIVNAMKAHDVTMWTKGYSCIFQLVLQPSTPEYQMFQTVRGDREALTIPQALYRMGAS